MVASFFVYTLFLISLLDTKPSPTAAHFSTWLVALVLELTILGASLAIYGEEHREPKAGSPNGGQMRRGVTTWEAVDIIFNIVRVLFLLALVLLYALFILLRNAQQERLKRAERSQNGSAEETTGLLNGNVENGHTGDQSYGSASGKDETSGWVRPTTIPSKSWWEYIRGYSLFFPYLWPAKSVRLQATVVFCFILVMIQRAVNVLVPNQVAVITNILSGGTLSGETLSGESGNYHGVPWGPICLYIFYRLLQGSNGVLGALRSTLWIPISQYSYQELSTASFEHVHGLSLDFHLGKKTGEVLSALSKGNSINTFLEQITFQVFPMLIDLAVAIGYFLIVFDAYYALVVAIVTFAYLYLTVRLAQWRAEIRREMVNSSRQEDAVK